MKGLVFLISYDRYDASIPRFTLYSSRRGNATGDVEVAQEWSEDSGHMHWLELTRRLLEDLEGGCHVISA